MRVVQFPEVGHLVGDHFLIERDPIFGVQLSNEEDEDDGEEEDDGGDEGSLIFIHGVICI